MYNLKNRIIQDEGTLAYCGEDDYSHSIIIGLSITNNHTAIINITLELSKTSGLTYIVKDLAIQPDETIVFAGETQKIMIEKYDSIILTSDYSATADHLSSVVSIMNIFKSGIVIPPPETIDWGGDTAIFAGGYSNLNIIESMSIAVGGLATDFGDLTVGRSRLSSCSNGTRGIFAGGYTADKDTIDYITFSSASNATAFGVLTTVRRELSACCDGTRGVISGSTSGSEMEYVTVAIEANSVEFGSLTTPRQLSSSISNGTIGLVCGDYSAGESVDEFTFSILASAVDFGGLMIHLTQDGWAAGCSDNTIGIIGGGYSVKFAIEYVYMDSGTDFALFGNLTDGRQQLASCADGVTAVFAGGTSVAVSTIDKITIKIASNATDYGDLTSARYDLVGCSGD